MKDETIIISNELGRLIDDYYKCPDLNLKKQICTDIQLLSKAMIMYEEAE